MTFRKDRALEHPQCKTCAMTDEVQNFVEAFYHEAGINYTQLVNDLKSIYGIEIARSSLKNHLQNHLPQAMLGVVLPDTKNQDIPKGYQQSFSFDMEKGVGEAVTPPIPEGKLITDWDEILVEMGVSPDEFTVVGEAGMSMWDQRAWDKDSEEFVTTKLKAYRLKIVNKAQEQEKDDTYNELVDIVKDVSPHKEVNTSGQYAFVFASGDLQLGKPDGDGLEGIVTRYRSSLQKAVNKAEFFKSQIGTILISWVGDCIEGNVSQGGKNAGRNEITVTMQVRLLRRLMMETIKAFAPLTNDLRVVSVPGNHDEAQREPVSTDPSDSWAVDALVAVSDALELAPEAFGHVTCSVVPYDEMTTTVEVAGTKIGHAHGHQWRKDKHFEWWMGQKWGDHEIGDADILVCGHNHSGVYAQQNFKHFIQVPSFEKESTYFRHKTGLVGNPSGVSFLAKDGKLKFIDFE